MINYANKAQKHEHRSVAHAVNQTDSNSKSVSKFEDKRPETIQWRKAQKIATYHSQKDSLRFADNRPKKAISTLSANESSTIQKRPILPIQEQDHELVALLTNGGLQPTNAKLKDERRREDGMPQTLTILTYSYQGQNVSVHIHAVIDKYIGHIDMNGGGRLDLTSGQSAVILRLAQESGIATEYNKRGQDWERGEYGHSSK